MAALARHRPRPVVTFTPVSLMAKYQHRRMKDMLRSCLGNPPGGTLPAFDPNSMGAMRGLALNGLAMPGSATAENFPQSAGGIGSFAPPLSAGLDGQGNRRGSTMGMGGRMIAPGQLPPQRKGSMASVASVGMGS